MSSSLYRQTSPFPGQLSPLYQRSLLKCRPHFSSMEDTLTPLPTLYSHQMTSPPTTVIANVYWAPALNQAPIQAPGILRWRHKELTVRFMFQWKETDDKQMTTQNAISCDNIKKSRIWGGEEGWGALLFRRSHGRLYREQIICLSAGRKSKQGLQHGNKLGVWGKQMGSGSWNRVRERLRGDGITQVGRE